MRVAVLEKTMMKHIFKPLRNCSSLCVYSSFSPFRSYVRTRACVCEEALAANLVSALRSPPRVICLRIVQKRLICSSYVQSVLVARVHCSKHGREKKREEERRRAKEIEYVTTKRWEETTGRMARGEGSGKEKKGTHAARIGTQRQIRTLLRLTAFPEAVCR